MSEEDTYKAQLKANGVELPEEEPTEEPAPEPEAPAKEKPEETDTPLTTPEEKESEQPRKPRSIYDEYKDKKSEARTERERADNAEQERDELRAKIDELSAARPGQASDAEQDLRTFAAEKGADPELVERIVAEARKGFGIDDELKKDIADLKTFKAQNARAIEQQMFEAEFTRVSPSIAQLLGNPSREDLDVVKKELDAISHTKDWHDKDLDYIAYKNQDALKALVSPKKRGMESKGRQDAEVSSTEFDPNADYASLTSAEKLQWEAAYKKATKSDGLYTNGKGGKLLI